MEAGSPSVPSAQRLAPMDPAQSAVLMIHVVPTAQSSAVRVVPGRSPKCARGPAKTASAWRHARKGVCSAVARSCSCAIAVNTSRKNPASFFARTVRARERAYPMLGAATPRRRKNLRVATLEANGVMAFHARGTPFASKASASPASPGSAAARSPAQKSAVPMVNGLGWLRAVRQPRCASTVIVWPAILATDGATRTSFKSVQRMERTGNSSRCVAARHPRACRAPGVAVVAYRARHSATVTGIPCKAATTRAPGRTTNCVLAPRPCARTVAVLRSPLSAGTASERRTRSAMTVNRRRPVRRTARRARNRAR